ncbi:DUF1934 domain-containing protein [Amphibacillus xylanus]|uniref:DUF1934 domain-containing protein n=1 Tax=Amphibacillus xylanus (strain ATCC 51415 / DSM 6626 / JCM 7361 / LMG 17667 / NBRC 15112 / Ep01) TaxID=698758 RepID=K0J076_AMPXN|nr:DUF1934 domain-containing protein [Amphibacillus xylanus]BAM48204.1 hypothetical protein AXY_20720 [Amphibacillus xylanus NBRC 15112]
MRLGKFFVKINLQTEIDDGHDCQQTLVDAKGELIQTERQTVIRFNEVIDQQPDVATMVTIKSDQIAIKRSGGVEMVQQFRPKQITETIYRHQFGSIRMETQTQDFYYRPMTANGSAELKLNYRTKLDGEEERTHKLLLTIKEDNQ